MSEKGENLLGTHLARFLVGLSGLEADKQGRFAELVTNLVAAMEDGHSCLQVTKSDKALLTKTTLVSQGDLTPLVLVGNMLYMHRYFKYESRLARQIGILASKSFEVEDYQHLLDAAFGVSEDTEDSQKSAVELALLKPLCIISGGPGTGKTSTVARIITILLQVVGSDCRIALAAPTGKAAMRLHQSVSNTVDSLSLAEEIKNAVPDHATTLHRLLGVKRFSPQFQHNNDNPLEWDVVVVDEASMVDLALMSKLVDALKPGARLILLGDKNQLVSVESGSVFADLIEGLPENTVILTKSYRFDETIKSLAEAANRGEIDRAWSLLEGTSFNNVGLLKTSLAEYIDSRLNSYKKYIKKLERRHYIDVFKVYNRFRILCATRSGRLGVEGINALAERSFAASGGQLKKWYPGRPVMIGRNDYSLDLYNGDIGICLPDPDDKDRLKVWFETSGGAVKSFLPFRLPQCETVYGMTIHKSQGSEFDEVLIVLPEEDTQLLSRELIYTAITRTKKRLQIYCNRNIWGMALCRKIVRTSGLAGMLCHKTWELD